MAYAVVETVKRPVPTTVVGVRPLTPQELARIRSEISRAIRSFWSSPEGQQLRMLLSQTAKALGWDKVMKEVMEGVKDTLRDEAERLGLGDAYQRVWGKG